MSNEIQIYNKPLTAAEIRANVNRIQEVMEAVMKKDVHYGTIPGTQKPTLFKAGSEKILSTFRIAVEIEVDDLSNFDSYRYRVKARGVLPSGEIIGCGIGECSTDEEKYRWRSAVNDKEWDATPEDRKRIKYIKPNQYNKDGEIRQIRTNPADLANTVLKMAKKRAQIDLTLTATAASDVFEQDIEDLPEEYREDMRGSEPKGKPEVKPPQSRNQSQNRPADNEEKKATDAQVKLIGAKLTKAGVDREAFKAHFGLQHVADIPMSKVNEAIAAIDKGEIKALEPTAAEVCGECGQSFINGACRNMQCPDGKPEDE